MTLRQMIRDEVDATVAPVDPDVIAEAIIGKVDDDHILEALSCMVREVMVSSRTRSAGPPPGTKSWKRSAIRKAEVERRTALDDRYATSEGYKRLGDFTYDDLLLLAERHRRLAEANRVQAERLVKVAEKMLATKAETVGEIPGVLEFWAD